MRPSSIIITMYSPASRALLRSATRSTVFSPARTVASRRFVSTNAPHLRRSWKSSALRWGIAAAGIYYYNTSPVFAEHPENNLLNPNVDALKDDEEPSLLDTLTASSRRKSERDASVLQSAIETTSNDDAMNSTTHPSTSMPLTDASPAELEEQADQQGAFNPETGEINWDCPCLGGMAHGPCGPQFREAFSCFVYSTEEPKGMDCIDKFQNMQNCFREHPEVYQAELEDDEELDAELAQEKEQLTEQIAQRKAIDKQNEQRLSEESAASSKPTKATSKKSSEGKPAPTSKSQGKRTAERASSPPSSEPHPGMSEEHEVKNEGQRSSILRQPNPPAVEDASTVEDAELVPRAAHDARNAPQTSK